MVSIDTIKRVVANYIDTDVVPVMPKAQGVLLATMAPLIIEAQAKKILQNPIVKMAEISEGDNVDIEKLYSEFKKHNQGKFPIEVYGFKISENDVDTLYQRILQG